MIQVGVTLSDKEGQMPMDTSTWQFHLKYDLEYTVSNLINRNEQHAEASIDLLKTAGIDFAKHKRSGINPFTFAECLTTSGLVLTEEVQWVCFHGLFDFAYLLKMLTGEAFLPEDEYLFQDILRLYFPHIYDVKTMAAPWNDLQGGLSKLCQKLDIKRIGTQHQAGSDSLITAAAFFALKQKYYADKSSSLENVHNVLFGIEASDLWDGPFGYVDGFRGYPVGYSPLLGGVLYEGSCKKVPMKQTRKSNRMEGKFGNGASMCVSAAAN